MRSCPSENLSLLPGPSTSAASSSARAWQRKKTCVVCRLLPQAPRRPPCAPGELRRPGRRGAGDGELWSNQHGGGSGGGEGTGVHRRALRGGEEAVSGARCVVVTEAPPEGKRATFCFSQGVSMSARCAEGDSPLFFRPPCHIGGARDCSGWAWAGRERRGALRGLTSSLGIVEQPPDARSGGIDILRLNIMWDISRWECMKSVV